MGFSYLEDETEARHRTSLVEPCTPCYKNFEMLILYRFVKTAALLKC